MGLTRLCTLCADVDRSSLDSPFYACAFRRKLYYSLDELQTDADTWMQSYNAERMHSGRHCYGKTP